MIMEKEKPGLHNEGVLTAEEKEEFIVLGKLRTMTPEQRAHFRDLQARLDAGKQSPEQKPLTVEERQELARLQWMKPKDITPELQALRNDLQARANAAERKPGF